MSYKLNEHGHVVNDDGMVAMQYVINENGKAVEFQGKGYFYVFQTQHHVPLAWVRPEDVPTLLGIQEKGCACNNAAMKQAFVVASLANVNIHHTGNM